MDTNIFNELLSQKQAREYLKCSESFLAKKRKAGEIKFLKAGRKVLIPKEFLIDYLKKGGESGKSI